MTDARDLARKIGGLPPGTTVKLGILRGGSDKTVSLTLGELPNAREARADTKEQPAPKSSNEPRLGLSLTRAAASRVLLWPRSIRPVPPPISASRPAT